MQTLVDDAIERKIVKKRNSDVNPPELGGMLLYGPPGNGKTRFAEALAHDTDLLFCPLSAGYFAQGFAGEGASRAHALEKLAKKHSSHDNQNILFFIDELDAVGKKRDSLGSGSAAANMEATMASLWLTMDSLKTKYKYTLLLAATNQIHQCDSALLRRFERKVEFPNPNKAQLDSARDYHIDKLNIQFTSDIRWPYTENETSFDDIYKLIKRSYYMAYVEDEQIITQEYVDESWQDTLKNKALCSIPSREEERLMREKRHLELQEKSFELQKNAHRENLQLQQEQFRQQVIQADKNLQCQRASLRLQQEQLRQQVIQADRNLQCQRAGLRLQERNIHLSLILAVEASQRAEQSQQLALADQSFYSQLNNAPFGERQRLLRLGPPSEQCLIL